MPVLMSVSENARELPKGPGQWSKSNTNMEVNKKNKM